MTQNLIKSQTFKKPDGDRIIRAYAGVHASPARGPGLIQETSDQLGPHALAATRRQEIDMQVRRICFQGNPAISKSFPPTAEINCQQGPRGAIPKRASQYRPEHSRRHNPPSHQALITGGVQAPREVTDHPAILLGNPG